jgi:hypothetical protein
MIAKWPFYYLGISTSEFRLCFEPSSSVEHIINAGLRASADLFSFFGCYVCFEHGIEAWHFFPRLVHRTVKGSLVLKRNGEGKIFGSLKYEGAKGSMIPSNGFFSFEEEKRKEDKIEYAVIEQFCWKDVGTNAAPFGCIQVVERAWALGLNSDILSNHSKLRWNGHEHELSLIMFGFKRQDERRIQSWEKAKELTYAYNNVTASWLCTTLLQFPPDIIAQLIRSFQGGCKIVTASWLCTQLQFPPKILAQLIRSFQYPPPAVWIKEGDLVLSTNWAGVDEDNTILTCTIARRRHTPPTKAHCGWLAVAMLRRHSAVRIAQVAFQTNNRVYARTDFVYF